MKLYVRKIQENESKRANELFYIAFEQQDTSTVDKSTSRELSKAPNRFEHYSNEKWAAFDEDENMMGVISVIPYDIEFDGNVCAMTGIGGVSCLAQHRRKGVVKACFQASLKDMYRDGFAFSYLYPFSTAYYRKFGYELCSEQARYSISTKAFKHFDVGGETYLSERGSHLEDIKKVYDDFKQGYNLMVAREEIDYSWVVNSRPAKDGHYTYVYKNAFDEAKGVISFCKVKSEHSFEMKCDRFFFSDMEGFKGLLNHVLMFEAYYECVTFALPVNINIVPYIPEWALHPCSCQLLLNGMVRAVNVQKVLGMAQYRGGGRIIISISDNMIQENNGCFEVVFENGHAASVILTENQPDVELSVADFSRCIMGAYSPEEVRELESVQINTDTETVGKVFYKKPNFIADYF
jgi:predicted acetyltransferase